MKGVAENPDWWEGVQTALPNMVLELRTDCALAHRLRRARP